MEILRDTKHTHCVIEASPEGRKVYDQLGFVGLPSVDTLVVASRGRRLKPLLRLVGWLGERVLVRTSLASTDAVDRQPLSREPLIGGAMLVVSLVVASFL